MSFLCQVGPVALPVISVLVFFHWNSYWTDGDKNSSTSSLNKSLLILLSLILTDHAPKGLLCECCCQVLHRFDQTNFTKKGSVQKSTNETTTKNWKYLKNNLKWMLWTKSIVDGLPLILKFWSSTRYQNQCQIPKSWFQSQWSSRSELMFLFCNGEDLSCRLKGVQPCRGTHKIYITNIFTMKISDPQKQIHTQ